MSFDSLRRRVSDFTSERKITEEEDLSLSTEELQLQEITGQPNDLDTEIRERMQDVEGDYIRERNRLEARKEELESERGDIASDIDAELRRIEETRGKIRAISDRKYATDGERVRRKCDELLHQLEGMQEQLEIQREAGAVSAPFSALHPMAKAARNPLYGGGGFHPLSATRQEIQTLFLGGKQVDVFDHPFDSNHYRICNQGSAFPGGPGETCGCCSSGTIINKAGGKTTERAVVEYALQNGYCGWDGSTSPQSWAYILKGAGIPASVQPGTSLEELAEKVEAGHGVIIGVSARLYLPSVYGPYIPGASDGHAIVLESVIREHDTGRILEYVVSDSNGKSRDEACHRVPAAVLEKAFQKKHRASVVTDDVIW